MTAGNVVRATGVAALVLAGAVSAAAQRGPRGPRGSSAPPEKQQRGPAVQVAHQVVVAAAVETLPKPDRKSTRLNSSHFVPSRMPSSA